MSDSDLTLDLPSIQVPDFSVEARLQHRSIMVALKGMADLAAREDLERLFDRVHREALRLNCGEVVLDLIELEFLSSSCFKCLVTWVFAAQSLESRRKYAIRIWSNPNIHWQDRSLPAMARLGAGLVVIEQRTER